MAKASKSKVKTAAKAENKEVMSLVRDFLHLNQKQRRKDSKPDEVNEWYDLKQKIEMQLFSQPPVPKDLRKSLRIGGIKQPVMFEGEFDGLQGVIKEVSEGGLYVALQDPLPVGSEAALFVSVEDAEGAQHYEIRLLARVVYNNVGYSLADRTFTGMGMILSEKTVAEERQKWFAWLDDLLNQASSLHLR